MANKKILEVNDLTIQYKIKHGVHFNATKNVSFNINEGEVFGLFGESGSGKSTIAKAIMGLVNHSSGNIKLNGEYIPNLPKNIKGRISKWLASNVQMIFQDAKSSLNPREKIYSIVIEGAKNLKLYKKAFAKDKLKKMSELLEDEQYKSIYYFEKLKRKHKFNINKTNILALHDKEFAKIFTDYEERRIEKMEMISGAKTKINTIKTMHDQYKAKLIFNYKKAFKKLVDEELQKNKTDSKFKNFFKQQVILYKIMPPVENKKLIDQLKKEKLFYKNKKNKMLDEIRTSLTKQLKDFKQLQIASKFKKAKRELNIIKIKNLKEQREQYSKDVHDIKNNFSSEKSDNVKKLIQTFKDTLSEKIITKKIFYDDLLRNVLDQVSIPHESINRFPGEFSGGQAQRIAIARTLVMEPNLIVADEPISALDVSIQSQVINILKKLISKNNLTMLFIAHDLQIVKYISDRIAVIHKGEIVETGLTHDIYNNPKHPYTQTLINAIPSINDPNKLRNIKSYKPKFIEDFSNFDKYLKVWANVGDEENHMIYGYPEQIEEWLAKK